ncbi:alpha/beta hydrolase [Pseudomaricurvus sp.]|uniref:alpha/beta hydrolase n=1 Tax=Pseudomaricurvus sp. TaxID=2004510 RepID=UPI003F6CD8BD
MTDYQLDPVVEEVLKVLADLNLPAVHDLTPDQARSATKAMQPEFEPLPLHLSEDRMISMSHGSIPVRIYRPSDEENLPAVVFYHGGGWVICDLDTHDDIARHMALQANCVVISVDYRLAPESKFPAAADDAYGALCWVADNAEALGIDETRIAVAGDSAGGNLAAGVALRARDEKGPAICFQSLWYPVTNVSLLETPSYSLFSTGYYLDKDNMAWFIQQYLDDPKDALNPMASPLLASRFTDLPPAYVMTAAFDVLRDEGQDYAKALQEAGVSVEYHCFDGLIHGFMNMNRSIPAAQLALNAVMENLKQALWQR